MDENFPKFGTNTQTYKIQKGEQTQKEQESKETHCKKHHNQTSETYRQKTLKAGRKNITC